MRRLIMLCALLLCVSGIYAQEVTRNTYHYATHDNQELRMDVYEVAGDTTTNRPCMIFAFGGGFVRGERDHEYYTHYFNTLARHGIVTVSIDYRLGLKDASVKMSSGISNMVNTMQNAIDIAVEDTYAATKYIIDNSQEWRIDPTKIMLSGSSAGAITVLHAERDLCNRTIASRMLPRDFRYAGVIAYAGAIFTTTGKPDWQREPAPMLLFHGTSDRNVPYKKASILGIGFYGAKSIAKCLDKMESPYYFYAEQYADHAMAVTPMWDKMDLILQFINDYVISGKRLRTRAVAEDDTREKAPTRFSVKEYLSTNYSTK